MCANCVQQQHVFNYGLLLDFYLKAHKIIEDSLVSFGIPHDYWKRLAETEPFQPRKEG